MRSAEALQKVVMQEDYTKNAARNDMAEVRLLASVCLHCAASKQERPVVAVLQNIHDLITDMSFVADMEQALRLLQPILALLQSLEADKPLLSQCLPLWLSVFRHVKKWAAEELQETPTLASVLLKRFGKCYHKAMSAAFLCDPAFFTYDAEGDAYTADAARIAEIEAELKIDIWADATQVCFCTVNPV